MELGSEYHLNLDQLELPTDNIFTYLSSFNTIYTDSGRSALKLLLSHLNYTHVFLPNYICDSVISAIPNSMSISYYPISKTFTPELSFFSDLPTINNSIIYIMNYFGQTLSVTQQQAIFQLKQQTNVLVIEDTTHSLLSTPCSVGDFCICSLRKWFPVPDGGVLYSKNNLDFLCDSPLLPKPITNKLVAMLLKNLFLQNKLDCNKLYRSLFIEEETKLDLQTEIYSISNFSYELLNYFSISTIKSKRIDNGLHVHSFLSKYVPQKLVFNELAKVPFCIPIYCTNRDSLRNYLIENNIYCAVHWPLEHTPLVNFTSALSISKHIISLPIDQRYSSEHMAYLIEKLRYFFDSQ